MQSAHEGVSSGNAREENPNQAETQLMNHRSSDQKSNFMKSGDVQVPADQLGQIISDPNDIANITSVTSRKKENKNKSMLDLD